MKRIYKHDEPQELKRFKANAKRKGWRPKYSSLHGKTKRAIKQKLMEEQGYICCYCEKQITDDDSHIEHLRPQALSRRETVNYNNMLCSCQKDLKKGEARHCGNLKGSSLIAITPLDEDCENKFSYGEDGSIRPVRGDREAADTIEILGLNIDKLNALRSKAIEPFLDPDLTDEEMKTFVTHYLKKHNGKFGQFYTTIRYLFGSLR